MTLLNVIRSVAPSIAGVLVTALLTGPASASLTRDYQLNGSLLDSLGGPSLVSDGGTVGSTVYTFGKNQGLGLSYSALASTSTYSIQMVFELDQFGGYRKLIDFNSRATDDGFYFYPGNQIGFYNQGSGSTAVTTPVFVDVLLTRDAATNQLDGYLNGVLQFAFTDSGGAGIFRGSDSNIRFFEDDFATGTNEASPGSVDCIRIFNNALSATDAANLTTCGTSVVPPPPPGVPEPGSLPLIALGALAVAINAHRRKRVRS